MRYARMNFGGVDVNERNDLYVAYTVIVVSIHQNCRWRLRIQSQYTETYHL
jgi:hypothetical protein